MGLRGRDGNGAVESCTHRVAEHNKITRHTFDAGVMRVVTQVHIKAKSRKNLTKILVMTIYEALDGCLRHYCCT